jgi:hypothetical protein
MALACQAKNEPMSEELSDAVYDAATYLACGSLVSAGMDVDKAIQQFDERDFKIHLSYDGNTDEMELQIEWADGEAAVTVRTNE